MRFILIDPRNIVVNIVEVDPLVGWQPPAPYRIRPDDGTPAVIGLPDRQAVPAGPAQVLSPLAHQLDLILTSTTALNDGTLRAIFQAWRNQL